METAVGIFVILLLVVVWLAFLTVIPMATLAAVLLGSWKSFDKAGQEGWKALIPFYSTYKWSELADAPRWYWVVINVSKLGSIVFFFLSPNSSQFGISAIVTGMVYWVFLFLLSAKVSKAFGLAPAFALGLTLLPPVFLPILGFGSSTYSGSAKRLIK